MRKKSLILLVICILMSFQTLYASTSTYERTEDNLRIWDNINVNSRVKNAVLKTPKVDEKEKIYDFANLFSDTEEENLYKSAKEFIQDNNMDIVIVTIDENNKYSAMEYADDFYDYNYFGIGSTHDGLIMLIDMDNRKVWISTTGKAILMYNDSRIDNILDVVQDKLINKKYYLAALNFIDYSDRYAKNGIPSGNSNMKIDDNGNYVKKGSLEFNSISDVVYFVVGITFIPTIVTIILIIIGVCSHRNVKKEVFAKPYLKRGSINITLSKDRFVRTYTNRTRISSSSNYGGGSSTHSGSSGTSHGGGGRSF